MRAARSTGWTGVSAGTVSLTLWLLPFCLCVIGGGPIIILAGLLFVMPVITMSLVMAANHRRR